MRIIISDEVVKVIKKMTDVLAQNHAIVTIVRPLIGLGEATAEPSRSHGEAITKPSPSHREATKSTPSPLEEKERLIKKEEVTSSSPEKTLSKARARKKFVPPTVSEVEAYCQQQGYEYVNAQLFVDFYASKGWVVGAKKKMEDWQRAVSGWNTRNQTAARPNWKHADGWRPTKKGADDEPAPF